MQKKVLKAIKVREKLVIRLRKFVSSPASDTGSAAIAQELATCLQDAGIECVEALVEWMLIKGTHSSSTPVFFWRGDDYFLKMSRDLNFAIEALRGQGVQLVHTERNSLLIQPHQHMVDRALAAKAIIEEMISLPQNRQKSNLPDLPKIRHKNVRRSKYKQRAADPIHSGPSDRILTGLGNKLPKLTKTPRALCSEDIISTGITIAKKANDVKKERSTFELPETQKSDDEEYENDYEDMSGSDHEDEEVELVLDKVALTPTYEPDLTKLSTRQIVSTSDKELTKKDVKNAFDQMQSNAPPGFEYNQPKLSQMHSFQDDMSMGCELLSLLEDRDTSDPLARSTQPHVSNGQCVLETIADEESETRIATVSNVGKNNSELHQLNELLLKYSISKEKSKLPLMFTCEAFDWECDSDAVSNMFDSASFTEWIEATVSIPAVFNSHGLGTASQSTRLEAISNSKAAQSLGVSDALFNQTNCIVNKLFHGIASRLQSRTEMNFSEVIEVASNHIERCNMWEGIRDLLLLEHEHQFMRKRVSTGICAFIHVFYPYLVDLPYRKLLFGCREVFQLLSQSIEFVVSRDNALIDSCCKQIHINASLSLELEEFERLDDTDSIRTEKLIVLCDRGDVLGSSMSAVIEAGGLSGRNLFAITPYFKSRFGDKMINSIHVEEGEGRGPLKEWFFLVSDSFTEPWKLTENMLDVLGESDAEIVIEGNRLFCATCCERLSPGVRLVWTDIDGTSRTCVITTIVDSSTAMLDISVSNNTMHVPVRDVRLYHHTTPVLSYIQGNESVWFNRDLPDTIESRERLIFLGWFLANAIVNLTRLDHIMIPAHFYSLLCSHEPHDQQDLLDLARALNPDMVKALEKLEALPPKDFVEYLRLEGMDTALTYGEYINLVLENHFGEATYYKWQIQHIKHGFDITLPLATLRAEHISSADIHDMLHSWKSSKQETKTLREIYRIACDLAFAECEILQQTFWKVVDAFDLTTQRKLVKFITGVASFPLPGTEVSGHSVCVSLVLTLQYSFYASRCLFQRTHHKTLKSFYSCYHSHMYASLFFFASNSSDNTLFQTCDNTLELPNYWKAINWRHQCAEGGSKRTVKDLEEELQHLMRKKLIEAVDYSQGYSLDATSNVSAIAARNTGHVSPSPDDSLDSLHLLSLQDDTSC